MSTKMNFGPEWMRSAPAANKPTANGSGSGSGSSNGSNGGSGSPTNAGGFAAGNPSDRAPDLSGNGSLAGAPMPEGAESRRYTHDMMMRLFKSQELSDGFVVSEHVFSADSLDPVSLSELSNKEQEILAGSVNSGTSKRYNGNQQQQQAQQQQANRQQQQLQAQQQQSSNFYSRSGPGMQRSGSQSMLPGARAKSKDDQPRGSDRADHGSLEFNGGADHPYGIPGGGTADEDDDGSSSLWARQSIVRDTVGTFGADGVFRMGAAEDSDLLEGPPSRGTTRGDPLRDIGDYASRAASPAVSVSRMGGAGMLLQSQSQGRLAAARSPTVNRTHSGVNHGGSSWDDLGSKQSTTMQQQMLVERAEQMKWWYRDPQGSIQGPFSATNMQDWFSADYFPADLQVCHEGSAGFEALSSLVARIGNPQSVFIFAALVFITQSIQQRSGINTPATPAAMSRAPSAIQLTMQDADAHVSAVAAAAGISSAGALDNLQQDVRNMSNGVNAPFSASAGMFGGGAPSGDISTARSSASGTPSAGTGTSTAATQAAQLSLLLNEQFLLVSAINDRQHTIVTVQEQLQQSLTKLMQDLTQESNAIHFRAQIDRVPVQTDLLFALQQRFQSAEERLRYESAQFTQIQGAHIAQLEAKIDPVIRDIVLRSGPAFALNFISQQLQDLSKQIAGEANSQQVDSPASAQAAQEPASTVLDSASRDVARATPLSMATDETASESAIAKPTSNAPSSSAATVELARQSSETLQAADSVSEAQVKLSGMDISGNTNTNTGANADSSAISKNNSAKNAGASKQSADKPSAIKAAAAPSAKASAAKAKHTAQTVSSKGTAIATATATAPVTTTATTTPPTVAKPSKSEPKASSTLPSVTLTAQATPAPWSTSANTKAKQPKKSLLQIQQEEEEAMKKRQLADEQNRAQNVISRGFAGSYADRLGGSSGGAVAPPRSLASIMEEQSKETAKANTASTFTASVVANSRTDTLRTLSLADTVPPVSASQPPRSAVPSLSPQPSAWGTSTGSIGNSAAAAFASSVAAATAASNAASKQQAAKPAAKEPVSVSITSTTNIAVMPSMEFLEWCYSRLGSLQGIDINKFIEVLLTFPTQPAETTLEIIAEQIYAYSSTLNGRAFAEDFVKRRRRDFGAVRNGSLKSAPVNWMQVLGSSAAKSTTSDASTATSGIGSGFARIANTGSSGSRGSSTDSSFQVVSKKGRK